ncbi:hypothetical protein ISN44_As11g026180 [Arabidopsis suecica]|uniref:Uncharacterized protein n=1 Tax=Arabidopsis suecica TaxID=45249 RepID=A0A8T1ZC86_ARASU|nr:hypothetical protein ISN44_As11g026180 [Arabidopsis suecica]
MLNSNVDRHHLGIDRHHFPIETVSTFVGQESTKLDTDGSTSSESFNRHSPSVDRYWVRTTLYALVFPLGETVYKPKVRFLTSRQSKQEIHDERCKANMEKILNTMPKVNPEIPSPPLKRYIKRLINNGICAEEAALLGKDISLIVLQEVKKKKKMKVVVSEHVSSILKSYLIQKFSILDCSISTGRFPNSLYDLGSNINLMPHSVAVRLATNGKAPEEEASAEANVEAQEEVAAATEVWVRAG